MFGDVTFIWTVIISQLMSKVLITDARHYSDYEVARMPQYDYEGASPKAPVHPAEVGDEYHEPLPAVSPMANIDYKYIEEIPDSRKNTHTRKDLDTEYSWNRPLRNPRRQQRPLESEEQFDDEIIPKVKLNYRNINTNPKYKPLGGNRQSKNDDLQSRRNRHSRKWNQNNRQTEESDEATADDDKPEIDRELINQETTKGRRRKPRDKSMGVKRDDHDYQYDAAEHEFRKQMHKIREQSMLEEPPGLVPGPDYPTTRRPMRTRHATRTREDIDSESTGKEFDYYDMKRLKKERGRARKLELAFGRRRIGGGPANLTLAPDPLEREEAEITTTESEATETTYLDPRMTLPWKMPTMTPSYVYYGIPTRSTKSLPEITKPTTDDTDEIDLETTAYTVSVDTPIVTNLLPSTFKQVTDTKEYETSTATDTYLPETTSELTLNQVLLRKKAMKELSLAEKSRLSILKKAERKEGVKSILGQKPPVLLQVTPNMATVVMVEPPPDKNNPANLGAVMRAKEVSDDSPEKIELVKSLMRKKLISGARSFEDLTKDWDGIVCDYIDTDVLEKAMSHADKLISTTTTTTAMPTSSMIVEKQLSAALNNRQVRSDDLALQRVSTTRLGPKRLIITTTIPVITLPNESIDYGFDTEWTNFIKANSTHGLRYVFWTYAFCTFLALVQPILI